jgi:hypothetical protein
MFIILSLSGITFPVGITGFSLSGGNANASIGDDGETDYLEKQNGCRNSTKGAMEKLMSRYSA